VPALVLGVGVVMNRKRRSTRGAPRKQGLPVPASDPPPPSRPEVTP
jgi:hypothetical protein